MDVSPDDGPDEAPEEDASGLRDLASKFAEPDPEGQLPDPESELPRVPKPPDPASTADVPPGLHRAFWTTVGVFNVALLAISVGAMMVAFDVHRTLGAGILVVGLVSLVRGVRKYRALDERNWREDPD